MVDFFASLTSVAQAWQPLLAADEPVPTLLMRLDPQRRAQVLMALLGLVLVGVGLMVLAYLGGRYLRRVIRNPLRATRPREDDWSRKPLIPPEPASPPTHEPE